MNTGDLVFFRKRGIVPALIRFGSWLGAKFRREPVPDWIPHHVEIVVLHDGVAYLYGADAVAGFVRRPHYFRLNRLTDGKHYRVIRLDLWGKLDDIREAVTQLEGTPYEQWRKVLRTWREGNTHDSADRVFCSEAIVRVLQAADVSWVCPLDPENTTPMELYLKCLKHGAAKD